MEIFALIVLTLLISAPVSRVLGLKISYTGPIGDMRGTLNGMTYSIWKAGVAVAKKVASVISNPQSIEQSKIRCNMATIKAAWDLLTVIQKAAWQDWADTGPGMGNKDGGIANIIKGNGGKMSGWNAFVLANQWLVSADLSAVTAPPTGLAMPSAPTQCGATYALSTITVTWVDPPEIAVGDKIRVWLVSRNGIIHRQLNSAVADALQTKAITTVQGAGGVNVAVADYPGQYLVQVDCVKADGRKSGPSNTAEVTVA